MENFEHGLTNYKITGWGNSWGRQVDMSKIRGSVKDAEIICVKGN